MKTRNSAVYIKFSPIRLYLGMTPNNITCRQRYLMTDIHLEVFHSIPIETVIDKRYNGDSFACSLLWQAAHKIACLRIYEYKQYAGFSHSATRLTASMHQARCTPPHSIQLTQVMSSIVLGLHCFLLTLPLTNANKVDAMRSSLFVMKTI